MICIYDTMSAMGTIRTIACKLLPTPEQGAALDTTPVAFADACNVRADVARQTFREYAGFGTAEDSHEKDS
jgi:hypothetical protein